MKKKITPKQVTKLWKVKGSMAALADQLGTSENTIRRWSNGTVDINKTGYRLEIDRLLFEHRIS